MLRSPASRLLGLAAALFATSGCGPQRASPVIATNGERGNTSNSNSGGSNGIGAACSKSSDCASNDCLTGAPGGYCVADCTTGQACPSSSACEAISSTVSSCLASCTTSADCRSGYQCAPGANVCAPSCQRDTDCPGSTCNTSTGQCASAGGGTGSGCQLNSDCGANQTCNTATGVCAASSTGGGASTIEATHAAPPQVVNAGGPVLAHPIIVPVFFTDDDAATVASVTTFLSVIGKSAYWNTAYAEYGVGAATSTRAYTVADPAGGGSIDDSQITSWLSGQVGSTLPANDANTVYVLHFPASVTITMGGSQSCNSFGGYHSDIQSGNSSIAYAVLPRCPGSSYGTTDLNLLTGAESHELGEAATDPYPQDNPAFTQVDDGHMEWQDVLGGSEVGDMCAQNPDAFVSLELAAGKSFTVQRSWSNRSAAAGHDPCIPEASGEIYFNASPEETETVSYQGGNRQTVSAKGVNIAVGSSKTITLDLFADGNVGTFSVTAQDVSSLLYRQRSTMQISLSKSSGQNGDKIIMTVSPQQAQQGGVDEYMVIVTDSHRNTHSWIGLVGEN